MTQTAEDIYAADAVPTGDNVKARLHGLADQQIALEATVAKLEAELKTAKKDLAMIAGDNKTAGTLPTLMDELGVTQFKTDSGVTMEIDEQIYAGIPKNREDEAVKWFDDNGASKLVKRTFTISFSKDEETWAHQFEGQMKRRKKPLHCERRQVVHHSTLKAWVNEALREGKDIPLDLFGVFRRKISKVKT